MIERNIIRVDNFLTDIEFDKFNEELLKLNSSLREETKQENNSEITIKYSRVYLDDYYVDNRDKSNILKIIHANLFNEKIYNKIPVTEELLKMIPISDHSECQYTVYPKGGSYSWHTDYNIDRYYSRPFRIANYIYYLNDDFDGGELHISYKKDSVNGVDKLLTEAINYTDMTAGLKSDIIIVPKKNTLVIMPSDAWHTVTPITKGKRRTINGHIGFK
jgi:Rps23 Pro-64 3,4-dihydroxylase Tpa1-like proline 4-hydroxylase